MRRGTGGPCRSCVRCTGPGAQGSRGGRSPRGTLVDPSGKMCVVCCVCLPRVPAPRRAADASRTVQTSKVPSLSSSAYPACRRSEPDPHRRTPGGGRPAVRQAWERRPPRGDSLPGDILLAAFVRSAGPSSLSPSPLLRARRGATDAPRGPAAPHRTKRQRVDTEAGPAGGTVPHSLGVRRRGSVVAPMWYRARYIYFGAPVAPARA